MVFSADLDKVLASFIIAVGAASMDIEVTMFFAFWGINVLRKRKCGRIKKNFIEWILAKLMPRGIKKLKLSKMNMYGIGTWMFKKIMKKKKVSSLTQLMATARQLGVKFVVCQMSMDIMGIKKEELIDDTEFGGVTSYLNQVDQAKVNLFI